MRLTLKWVEQRLRHLNGNVAAVARAAGVTRQAVQLYVKRHPELQAVLKECRETMKDHAESALYGSVLAKEAWAVCFFLKTQARDRGYIEEAKVDHAESAGKGLGGWNHSLTLQLFALADQHDAEEAKKAAQPVPRAEMPGLESRSSRQPAEGPPERHPVGREG